MVQMQGINMVFKYSFSHSFIHSSAYEKGFHLTKREAKGFSSFMLGLVPVDERMTVDWNKLHSSKLCATVFLQRIIVYFF